MHIGEKLLGTFVSTGYLKILEIGEVREISIIIQINVSLYFQTYLY